MDEPRVNSPAPEVEEPQAPEDAPERWKASGARVWSSFYPSGTPAKVDQIDRRQGNSIETRFL